LTFIRTSSKLIPKMENRMSKDWTAEIAAIGSELLLGQIVDTNTSYLAARFQELRKGLAADCELGIFVKENEGCRVLHLGCALGVRSENFEHPIGGPPGVLVERVTVMALDWLRKMVLQQSKGRD
jgi:hypothetical protein